MRHWDSKQQGRLQLTCYFPTALPSNCEIISVSKHGKTNWASGLKVKVKLNGEEQAYFVKVDPLPLLGAGDPCSD